MPWTSTFIGRAGDFIVHNFKRTSEKQDRASHMKIYLSAPGKAK